VVQADYAHGRRHGTWTRWHADGRPAVRALYVDGLLDGELCAWYPDGTPALRASFRHFLAGRPAGDWLCRRRTGQQTLRCFSGGAR
jgi:antitoxin component YwqK of YwqJK toxin-antitoxin module